MRDVEVWDRRERYYNGHDGKEAAIGVNWSAIGPVTPSRARRFAESILKAADRAVERKKKARAEGFKLVKLP